jgi:hypothetical protein
MSRIITLMTDFGWNAAQAAMKGVILSIFPDVLFVDVSHTVAPQNIADGARTFAYSSPRFPADTIHICVVDPGVGTRRRPIAARLGSQIYVGPDNGLITLVHNLARQAGQPIEIYHTDKPEYWLPNVSATFHGRDIFAPVAAHLAKGVPLDSIGTRVTDPVLIPFPQPQRTPAGLQGEIIHRDQFGNIWTNIREGDLEGLNGFTVHVRDTEIKSFVRTFGERAAGDLIAYINSEGGLGIAVVNGNATKRLGAENGDKIELRSS